MTLLRHYMGERGGCLGIIVYLCSKHNRNHPLSESMQYSQNSPLSDDHWMSLLHAIKGQKVVPVIGDALIRLVDNKGTEHGFKPYILSKLKERFAISEELEEVVDVLPYIAFSNMRMTGSGYTTDVYKEIYNILANVTVKLPDFVLEVMQLCHFPLLLTTSIAPLCGALGTPQRNELAYTKSYSDDLSATQSPTATDQYVYHLFGEASSNTPNSFMATEDDLLDYMYHWYNGDTRPINISDYLEDKHLLVLGCQYPDWLFRFFWNSINNFDLLPPDSPYQGKVEGVASLDRIEHDKYLRKFLRRVNTATFDTAKDFMTELATRYTAVYRSREATTAGPAQELLRELGGMPEIFISYCNEDKTMAEQIAKHFHTATGNQELVWFDKEALIGGDRYREIIPSVIKGCQRFVAVISENSLRASDDRFFKTEEWSLAIEHAKEQISECFIVPIIIDHTDPADQRMPKEFRETHIPIVGDKDYRSQIARVVRSYRKQPV